MRRQGARTGGYRIASCQRFGHLVFDGRGGGSGRRDRPGEAKVCDPAYAHLIEQYILELDIPVNDFCLVVEIFEAADNLAEDGSGVIEGEARIAVMPQDIEEGAFGAQEGDKIDEAWKAVGREKREDIFVMKISPNRDFLVEKWERG